jgi:hypothetical protein
MRRIWVVLVGLMAEIEWEDNVKMELKEVGCEDVN